MPSFIGVYLHGFLSSGMSQKGQWFKNQNNVSKLDNVTAERLFTSFYTPTYPINSVSKSVDFIDEFLTSIDDFQSNVIIMGSSIGGFYAQYFGQKYGIPYVLINPALNPVKVFYENLGEHTNPATGEMVNISPSYIDNLLKYMVHNPKRAGPSLLLLDEDDEVIDVDYVKNLYATRDDENNRFKSVIYSGGDHRFIHLDQAWLEIQEFVQQLQEGEK